MINVVWAAGFHMRIIKQSFAETIAILLTKQTIYWCLFLFYVIEL